MFKGSAVLVILLSACGSPSPSGSIPLEERATRTTWKEVLEKDTSDMVIAGQPCSGARTFRVQSTGAFSGTCSVEQSHSGNLTDAEWNELSAKINAVIDGNPRGEPVCDSENQPIIDDDISVTLDSGQSIEVQETQVGVKTCFRGGQTNVENLRTYLHSLMKKYLPGSI